MTIEEPRLVSAPLLISVDNADHDDWSVSNSHAFPKMMFIYWTSFPLPWVWSVAFCYIYKRVCKANFSILYVIGSIAPVNHDYNHILLFCHRRHLECSPPWCCLCVCSLPSSSQQSDKIQIFIFHPWQFCYAVVQQPCCCVVYVCFSLITKSFHPTVLMVLFVFINVCSMRGLTMISLSLLGVTGMFDYGLGMPWAPIELSLPWCTYVHVPAKLSQPR